MMNWLKTITLSDIITLALILIGIASALIAYIKAKKSGNTAGQVEILNKIPELVIKAEQLFGAGNGSAKLQYVMNELRIFALERRIKVDNATLENSVNTMVNVSNNVNVGKLTTPSKPDAQPDNITTGVEDKQNTTTNIEII